MEDYHVAKFVHMKGNEIGLFGIYDGHLGNRVAAYLQKHLFANILREVCCYYSFALYLFFGGSVKMYGPPFWYLLTCATTLAFWI